MINAIVIPADAAEPMRVDHIDEHNLAAYQRLVDGLLEVVTLADPDSTMYLNEEGKVRGKAVNLRATALLWVHNPAFRHRDVIAGPAFIVGPPTPSGDDCGAPDDLISLLLHTSRYQVRCRRGDALGWVARPGVPRTWFTAYTAAIELADSDPHIQQVHVTAAPEVSGRDVTAPTGGPGNVS